MTQREKRTPNDLCCSSEQAERIERRLAELTQIVGERLTQSERLEAVVMILLARLGDPTRVTIKEAAALEERLYGKGSVKGVRAKVAAGKYTLEKRNGEKTAKIPVEQVYGDYVPIDVWRRMHAMRKTDRTEPR